LDDRWLRWAQHLQAAAQNGLTYSQDPYDLERYRMIREIAAEIAASHSGTETGRVRDLFAGEVGHATPKVDVRGAVFQGDTILLVKERADGLWTLPGGWADVGESPGDAVVREVYEESGYRTRAAKLLALYDRNKHAHPPHAFHIYKVFFLCELLGGTAATSIETDGVEFFRQGELPELSTGRVTSTQIDRFFEHLRHPEWPADFD
jgi:ADP-ribose pyrophosphatase YjhB (NUDIX family)